MLLSTLQTSSRDQLSPSPSPGWRSTSRRLSISYAETTVEHVAAEVTEQAVESAS